MDVTPELLIGAVGRTSRKRRGSHDPRDKKGNQWQNTPSCTRKKGYGFQITIGFSLKPQKVLDSTISGTSNSVTCLGCERLNGQKDVS
jgi:hypothetical protein